MPVLYAGVICLLIPCVLFILGWMKLIFAIPFALLLVAAAWICCRNIVKQWNPAYRSCVFSRRDCLLLLLTLCGLLVFVDLYGLTGHVKQAADLSVRNAIYAELINSPWPIYSNRGEYFIYYHAFWLPPALLAKMISGSIADIVLSLWVYVTLVISTITIFTKIRGNVVYFFLFFLLGGNIIENLKLIPILINRYGDMIPFADSISGVCKELAVESYYRYLNVWTQFVYSYNHAVPLFLYGAMLITGIVPIRYMLFVTGLVFASSPFGCLLLLPVLILIVIKRKSFKTVISLWENWVAALFVLFFVAYLYGQCGGSSGIVLIWQDFAYWGDVSGTYGAFVNTHVRMLRYVTTVAAMVATLWLLTSPRLRNNIWFFAFVFLAVSLPMIWIGRANNELLFKGSLILYMLFAWILRAQWRHSSRNRKIAIVLVVIFASFHIASDVNRRQLYLYTWKAEEMQLNKRLEWGGTLNRPDIYEYYNFWGENRFPSLFSGPAR